MIADAKRLVDSLKLHGVQLWARDGQVKFAAPAGVFSQELRDAVSSSRKAIIAYLESAARYRAEEEWVSVTTETARRYDVHHGDAVPWLDDHELTRAVGDALRACDVPAAQEAVEAWRQTWLDHLSAFAESHETPAGLNLEKKSAWTPEDTQLVREAAEWNRKVRETSNPFK